MPRGIKGSGPKGLQMAKQARLVGTKDTGLERDKEIEAAINADAEDLATMDDGLNPELEAESALESLGAQDEFKGHPIANGTTVPFPWEGQNEESVRNCWHHIKDQNRGCDHANVCKKAGLLGKGPFNLVYKDLRSGRVKVAHCAYFNRAYLHQPQIVLLPGVDWFPTRTAAFKPLPNGQQPVPGPGQARTPIVLTPHKTPVVCTPPAEVVKEFQKMRRRGDFLQRNEKRRVG